MATIREKQKAVEYGYKYSTGWYKNDYGSVLSDHQIVYIKFEIVSGQEPNINEG